MLRNVQNFLICGHKKEQYICLLATVELGSNRFSCGMSTGDLNETFFVGKVDEASEQLVRCTYECLEKAIGIGMVLVSSQMS